jgi:hypothetical protein
MQIFGNAGFLFHKKRPIIQTNRQEFCFNTKHFIKKQPYEQASDRFERRYDMAFIEQQPTMGLL